MLDSPVSVCFIISYETACKQLSSININKAIGPDGIPSWILRDHTLTLVHPISTIFNGSIREGYLPAIWRSAIVIPILKVNPPHNISKDLRPISLTAVLSKRLKRIVGGRMLDYIIDKLDMNQYGGLRGLSTTHVLVHMENRIDSERSHGNNWNRFVLWCGMFKTSPGENFISEGEFV